MRANPEADEHKVANKVVEEQECQIASTQNSKVTKKNNRCKCNQIAKHDK
jgi:hypothetical protein